MIEDHHPDETAVRENALNIWVVYANPADYPGEFVARRWIVHGVGKPTDDIRRAAALSELRDWLMAHGLVRLERHPTDDPCIIETWL